MIDSGQFAACLLRTRSGDPPHRIHHCTQLMNAVDTGVDISQTFRHPDSSAVAGVALAGSVAGCVSAIIVRA